MDHQKPHAEDEVYCVASGRAKINFESDGDAKSFYVYPGTIIFVPARVHHHSPGTNIGPGTGTYLTIRLSVIRGGFASAGALTMAGKVISVAMPNQ